MRKFTYYMLLVALSVKFLYSQESIEQQVYKEAVNSVVHISTPEGLGSGFFITKDGWIVTNKHVITNEYGRFFYEKDIKVRLRQGYIKEYSVSEIKTDDSCPYLDIALLKIDVSNETPLPIFDGDNVKIQEKVITIGHPIGVGWTSTNGVISNILDDSYCEKYIMIDAAVSPGNSGGPLLNMKGQVIGVNTSYSKVGQNMNVSIMSVLLSQVLKRNGIKYNTLPIVLAGLTALELQEVNLKKDQQKLQEDQERLREDRDRFDDYKQRENQRIQDEKNALSKERNEFQINKQNSWEIIERANIIRDEITKGKEDIYKKMRELSQREQEIVKKEDWIREKEIEIQKKLTNRFSLEFLANPSFFYNENSDHFSINLRGSVGLFYRFGFLRDRHGVVISSDRFGFVYGIEKNYDYKLEKFFNAYNQDLSIAFEFNDLVRIGIGKSIKNEHLYFGYKEYNLAYLMINVTGYPIPFGFTAKFNADNKFKLRNYSVGIYAGLNLTFLRL